MAMQPNANRPRSAQNKPAGNRAPGSGNASRQPNTRNRPASPAPQAGSNSRGPADRDAGTSRPQGRAAAAPADNKPKTIELAQQTTVRDLATAMGCSPIDLIKQLMNAGMMANINQVIDRDTATIVAEDMGFTVQEIKPPEPEVKEEPVVAVKRREYSEEDQKNLRERPPVVTILGHVDHGKTSLLDVIRTTNVQSREAGGITQHIGAYQAQSQDKLITFLDTPGHAAFTAMRARGASITDIAVLVVAADDGVQPQTREAIDHARAAGVPIIVALNKIDLPTANPDHVKHQLSDVGLVVEEWGGDTICVPVSARTKAGIDTLLDMILLVAEMANLKANPKAPAQGVVVEGRLDKSRGPTATLLVQDGTLKVGETLLVGQTYGKIRAMFDFQNKPVKRVTPSTPVVVLGLRDVPEAGDSFQTVESERVAREMAEQRVISQHAADSRPVEALTLDEIYERAQAGAVQALNIILKADVQGSIEPIKNSLEKLDVGDLKVKFVHQGVGNVAESDVSLALASQAVILGFSVNVDPAAQRMAEAEGVSIRTYNIIYRIIEDVQLALQGMLKPVYEEVVQGRAIVRQMFGIPKLGKIAGVQISEGKALRSAKVRVKRNDQVVFEGRVSSLRRYTEDVREVGAGMECGVAIDGYTEFQPNDVIEFYTEEQVK
ncbi:MAG: translation initiation factor IF-2 [Anaerolineae bacterium]